MEALFPRTKNDWPPGLTAIAFRRCPERLQEDAIQEAWLAVAEGRKPDSAVRALLRHEQKHAARKPNFDFCPTGQLLLRF